MDHAIGDYNAAQGPDRAAVCDRLADLLTEGLPGAEAKVWHGGPVWFLAGNPIAGYWVRKTGVQLLFWSGQDFDEAGLRPEGKFRAAEAVFGSVDAVDEHRVQGWQAKAAVIQ